MEKFLRITHVAKCTATGGVPVRLCRCIVAGTEYVHEHSKLRRFERSWQVGNEND
jgi:hypothetical protein